MKGLVKYGTGKEGMEIRQLPIPDPPESYMRVKVIAAGICGSDVHTMNDELPVKMPVVIGHEFVGVVDAPGKGVTHFKEGDYITSYRPYSSCGSCPCCREGADIFCRDAELLGKDVNGCMAEYVIVPEKHAFRIPDGIENKKSIAALEPFGCGLRAAAERTTILPGDLVVIIGPGMLGLSILQIAKLRGAYTIVFGLEKDGHRLALAKELGADDVETCSESLKRKVFLKNRFGADICFEATGVASSLNTCFDLVKRRGTITQLGLFNGFPEVNLNAMTDSEINLVSSRGCQKTTFELGLKLLEDNKIDLNCFIGSGYALDDWKDAFETAAAGKALKVILVP